MPLPRLPASLNAMTPGERALRWRIDLERFAPQLRAASP
jgi:hypothetical protein